MRSVIVDRIYPVHEKQVLHLCFIKLVHRHERANLICSAVQTVILFPDILWSLDEQLYQLTNVLDRAGSAKHQTAAPSFSTYVYQISESQVALALPLSCLIF